MSYPYIKCNRPGHNIPEPGYVVCNHVKDGEPVFETKPATSRDLGVINCKKCHGGYSLQNFTLACATCCRTKGWLPAAMININLIANAISLKLNKLQESSLTNDKINELIRLCARDIYNVSEDESYEVEERVRQIWRTFS